MKTAEVLLDPCERGRMKEDASTSRRSSEALERVDVEEEEEIQRKDMKAGRETESWTLNKDDKDRRREKLSKLKRRNREKRVLVYICGGYEDTAAERSAFMENVYPRLFLYCKQRGFHFSMVDLRAGVGSPAAERHDTARLHVENLQRCQETSGPNLVLFVGQKYEVCSPPATISREAFEAIVGVMKRHQQSKNQPAEDSSGPGSESGFATDSSSGSFVQDSIYRNYLNFGEQATTSELPSQSSCSSFSDGEEARLDPMGAKDQTDLDRDLTLLQTWYKLDENVVPPVYCLLPISSQHPDTLSPDRERRQQAGRDWRETSRRLWGLLQRNAAEALGQEEASLLLRTVLDWEVEAGLRSLHGAPPEDRCHCYRRVIPDLHLNLKNRHAARYVDLLEGRAEVDLILSTAQRRFTDRLHKKLRQTNIYERNVGWGQKGLDPKHNRTHRFYTDRISSHFQRTVINSLNSLMKTTRTEGPFDVLRRERVNVQITEEIRRHVDYGLQLRRSCTLRRAFLCDVRRAVEPWSRGPILLLGPPGWGKSTTMAAVAQSAPSWLPGAVVLVHFIGFTGESRNVRLVLQSLCVQLAETYCPATRLSADLHQLVNEFHSLLDLVGPEQPLVILLDGLDELSEDHGLDLSWISTPLPPNVRLILSATTDSSCSHTLQQSVHPTVLSLPPLSPDDITAALEAKLQADRRRLQQQQWRLLVRACRSCPCPLYLQAAYSESLLWTSFSLRSLPASLDGLYLDLLARLERELGRQLVRRAASLISVSRWGVTEEELLELLSKDEKVLQEVSASHRSSSSRRVPYVSWARLRRDLGHHLTEARTDGTWVYRWTHSKLSLVCMNHYLKTDDSRKVLHADYADYYRDPSQHVFQPLAWTLDEEEDDDGRSKSLRFNLRKLHGLPYHLVRSGQILPFLSECVFNYEFLLHKAWGLSVVDVQEDLQKAVLPDKVLLDVQVLSAALEMSQSVLLRDPRQLASQLTGRLGQMVMEDHPVAKGDPSRFSHLHALLAQCARSSLPVLLPSSTCLLPPGGPQHTLLAGHLTNVTALGVGQRGSSVVTSEADGSLRFWDLEQRRIVKSLDAEGGLVGDFLTLALDDRMLIVRMGQRLQVREVESGRVVYSENDSVDVPIVTAACDGQLLVVFYDGSHLVKVFDLASSCSLLHRVNISMEREATHKHLSILLPSSSIRDAVLFAYRSGSEAAVFSPSGGAVLSVLSAQHGAASIQAVEMTEDYLLLFCRYPYKRGSDIIHIELFSPASFLYLRSILGCSQDCLSQVVVNRAGTHAVAFCSAPSTGITELVTWNLETEDHKHITRFPAVLITGLCVDLRFCLGICSGEKYLHLWDLTCSISDQTLTYNTHKPRSDGTEEVFPVGRTPRYAVCRSRRAGTVYVWNLARRRFVCRPVRVERGLCSSTDVLLVHDFQLYILTDRNMNTDSNSPHQFQTLLVYDLIKRSYVRRQTGIAVPLCLQHEYRLLEDGRTLLGLSGTRDHVVLWDLDSGSIKHEIKPSCRDPSSTVQDLQPCGTPPRDTPLMPWDIRTESRSAKERRLQREAEREEEEEMRLDREKLNSMEQFLLSGDEQVLVCSYFAHHLHVFSLASREHLCTLKDKTSLLSLQPAALTHSGGHLVLTGYDQDRRSVYVSLWDVQAGAVRKRLRNVPAVCCVAATDHADRIVFGVTGGNGLKVWEPFTRNYKSIDGSGNLRMDECSKLHLTEGGARAVLLAGQLMLWDLEACSVLAVLSLDAHVRCAELLGGREASVLLGLSHSPVLIAVRATCRTANAATYVSQGGDLFGESSSSEEEDP
ncbi:NACHT and WD repeat domain-containing protein 2 [Embiotoca jacksoni]|uniref:NACHT and WD repeat domain-containing protein 2 n=1 Tax=Embiotoca jacksoni TaxID=100190 RepID=UPI00370459C5